MVDIRERLGARDDVVVLLGPMLKIRVRRSGSPSEAWVKNSVRASIGW